MNGVRFESTRGSAHGQHEQAGKHAANKNQLQTRQRFADQFDQRIIGDEQGHCTRQIDDASAVLVGTHPGKPSGMILWRCESFKALGAWVARDNREKARTNTGKFMEQV